MVTITQQPTGGQLVAAYEPIILKVDCNQGPTGGGTSPCPVVIADLYFDGIYYQSLSVTDYELFVFWVFVFVTYEFDISDKVQEYLNSKLPYMVDNMSNTGIIENKTTEIHSVKIEVVFRESYVDANGITQIYGTAPVAGTKYSAPVAGTGTATSNEFVALNANLRHEDNPDLKTHLSYYKDSWQLAEQLSHRPNFGGDMVRVGGGNYYIGRNDNDYIFIYSPVTTSGWSCFVTGKYKDGTTFTASGGVIPNNPVGVTFGVVFAFNCGIPGIRGYFTTVNWLNVSEYEFRIVAPFFQGLRQKYVVRDYCEYVRLFFRSTAGGWDAINFQHVVENTKTESGIFKTIKSTGKFGNEPLKSSAGLRRLQSKQGETLTLQCSDYGEKDQNWLKELDASPQSFIQWPGEQGQKPALIAVVILDTERTSIKAEGRHDYLFTIQIRRSNDVVSLRS